MYPLAKMNNEMVVYMCVCVCGVCTGTVSLVPRPLFGGEEKRPGTICSRIPRKVGMRLLYIVLYPYVNWTILQRFYGKYYACANRLYQTVFSPPQKKNSLGMRLGQGRFDFDMTGCFWVYATYYLAKCVWLVYVGIYPFCYVLCRWYSKYIVPVVVGNAVAIAVILLVVLLVTQLGK